MGRVSKERASRRSERVVSETKIEKSTEHKQDELALKALDFVNKKRSISLLNKDCNTIRPSLEKYMDSNEVELPNGSKECTIPYLDVDIKLKRTARDSATLKEDALEVVRELGYLALIETKEVLNEEELQLLIADGTISNEDALRIYEHKRSYAFSVSAEDKEGM